MCFSHFASLNDRVSGDMPAMAQEFSLKDRAAWLRTLAVSGFAPAFEALVDHDRVGQLDGVLDEGTGLCGRRPTLMTLEEG